MAPRTCALCNVNRAVLKRPKTGQQICKDCFFWVFETEVHNTITEAHLFKPGDRVAIGASGGKGEHVHCPRHLMIKNLTGRRRCLKQTRLSSLMS
jgi:cytoplasmic tRNA 2-thiolation protein 1